MNNKLLLNLILLFFINLSLIHSQQVSDIKVRQDDMKYIVKYNLAIVKIGQSANIDLYISEDAGEIWQGPLKAVSGDVGKNIYAGDNKQIVWDVSAEPGTHTLVASKIQFKVIADTVIAVKVTDADGNSYDIVTIGSQTWMKENLKTTKYNDGKTIPNVTDPEEWSKLTTPAYCWYNNDITNKDTYQALYNWYSVNTDNLCPTGWHVPNNEDWANLIFFLGGEEIAGGKLKEAGTAHWNSPNNKADDSYGFTALPSGNRISNGTFRLLGNYCFWWSADQVNVNKASGQCINRYGARLLKGDSPKVDGFSVRCIQNK